MIHQLFEFHEEEIDGPELGGCFLLILLVIVLYNLFLLAWEAFG